MENKAKYCIEINIRENNFNDDNNNNIHYSQIFVLNQNF